MDGSPALRTKEERRRPVTTPAAIQRVADTLSPKLRREFLQAIRALAKDTDLNALAEAFKARDFAQIDALLHVPTLPQMLRASAALVVQTFQQAGVVASASLADVLHVSIRFDVTNPHAVAYARNASAELVTNITATTRQTIRDLIAAGLEQGIPPVETARILRNSIGLTERQAMAVIHYRLELLEQGRSAEDIARLTDRYSRQLLNYRARLIARTETQRSAVQGQREAWRQAASKGLINPAITQRVWQTSEDERVCPICAPMDGQAVAFEGEPFTGGDDLPYDDPPAHPACRCNCSLRFID